jgi:hypothetical protein
MYAVVDGKDRERKEEAQSTTRSKRGWTRKRNGMELEE